MMLMVKHPHILLNLNQKKHSKLILVQENSNPKVQLILRKEEQRIKDRIVCFAKAVIHQTDVTSTRHMKLDGLVLIQEKRQA